MDVENGRSDEQRALLADLIETAAREGLTDRYVARLLELAFLPSATVEAILDGRQPVEWTSETLSRAEQEVVWSGRGAWVRC